MTKVINGNWIMEKNEVINEDLVIEGNILGKDGRRFNLKIEGNLSAFDISVGDVSAYNISVWDISAWGISTNNISAWNILAKDISADNIDYHAVCYAYNSIKCKSIKGRRMNSKHFVLDGDLIVDVKVEK